MTDDPRPTRSEAAAVVALTVLACAIRVDLLGHGAAPDELANLFTGPAWRIPLDPESGVNPPLLRTLVHAIAPDPAVLRVGRVISVLAGTATVPLGWRLGRRLGGPAAGLLAALVLAVHPPFVWMGARFRAYVPFAVVAAWHLDALSRWLDDPRPRARREAVASAVLLPWLHYLALPLLLGVAVVVALRRGVRGVVAVHLPAAIGALPLAAMVLQHRSTRVPTPVSVWASARPIVALGLRPPSAVERWMHAGPPPVPPDHVVTGAVVLLALITLSALPRGRDRRAPLLGAAWGLLLGVLALGAVQYVRATVAVLLLVPLAPLLASAVTLPRTTAGRVGVGALLGVTLFSAVPRELLRRHRDDPERGIGVLAASVRAFDAVRGERPVVLYPHYAYVGLYHELTGRHVAEVPGSGCGPGADCFEHGGIRYVGVPEHGFDAVPGGLVALTERTRPRWTATCTEVHAEPGLTLLDCPGAWPASAQPEP